MLLDTRSLPHINSSERIAKLLELKVYNTGYSLNLKELATKIGMNRITVKKYIALQEHFTWSKDCLRGTLENSNVLSRWQNCSQSISTWCGLDAIWARNSPTPTNGNLSTGKNSSTKDFVNRQFRHESPWYSIITGTRARSRPISLSKVPMESVSSFTLN